MELRNDTTPDFPILEQALILARQGYRVFPLRPADKRPAIQGWQDRASDDETTIRAMPWHDDSNIAIQTGTYPGEEICLVVIDLDNAAKKGPFAGQQVNPEQSMCWQAIQVVREACRRDGSAKGCRIHETPSGGLHLYILADSPVASQTDLLKTKQSEGWAIDVKAEGGYVVAPGSVVPPMLGAEAKPYVVIEGVHIHLHELTEFSLEWLRENGIPLKEYRATRDDRGPNLWERRRAARSAVPPLDIPEFRDALFYLIDSTPPEVREAYEWWRNKVLFPLTTAVARDPRPRQEGEIPLKLLFDEACIRCGGRTENNQTLWYHTLESAKRKLNNE